MLSSINAERGFTLLELVIASSLLAILGLSTALVLNSGLTNAEALEQRSQQLQQLDRAITLLQRDLTTMLPRQNRASDSLNLSPDSRQALWGFSQPYPGNGLLLEFTRPSPWALNRFSGLHRVRYRLLNQQLIRENVAIADPTPSAQWQSRVLLNNVTQLELLFLSQRNWRTDWHPDPMRGPLPDAIMLKLTQPPWGELQFIFTEALQ